MYMLLLVFLCKTLKKRHLKLQKNVSYSSKITGHKV